MNAFEVVECIKIGHTVPRYEQLTNSCCIRLIFTDDELEKS